MKHMHRKTGEIKWMLGICKELSVEMMLSYTFWEEGVHKINEDNTIHLFPFPTLVVEVFIFRKFLVFKKHRSDAIYYVSI